MQKETGQSTSSIQIKDDPRETIPSFEESSSFPMHDPCTNPTQKNHPREELVGGPRTSNVKRAYTNLDSFFVPWTTPGAQPTTDTKRKKMEKEAYWECTARWW